MSRGVSAANRAYKHVYALVDKFGEKGKRQRGVTGNNAAAPFTGEEQDLWNLYHNFANWQKDKKRKNKLVR